MNNDRYLAEYMPVWKRIDRDNKPAAGVKMLLRTAYGSAVIGQYYPDGEFTHWCGLPKLSKEDKEIEKNAKTKAIY